MIDDSLRMAVVRYMALGRRHVGGRRKRWAPEDAYCPIFGGEDEEVEVTYFFPVLVDLFSFTEKCIHHKKDFLQDTTNLGYR